MRTLTWLTSYAHVAARVLPSGLCSARTSVDGLLKMNRCPWSTERLALGMETRSPPFQPRSAEPSTPYTPTQLPCGDWLVGRPAKVVADATLEGPEMAGPLVAVTR